MSRMYRSKYFDHDDRGSGSNLNIRKVSFKNNYGRVIKEKPKKVYKAMGKFLNKLMDDDDVDMGGCDILGHRMGKRRNFKGRARSPGIRPNNILKLSDWYKVKIPFGGKYDKKVLLQILLKYMSPNVFVPVAYSVIGNTVIFYVDDMKAAQLLQDANTKITLPDGFKMKIQVQSDRQPQISVEPELKEKIKSVMSVRYIAENKALDLSKFAKDPGFYPGFYCPLSRSVVLRAVLQIISDNIPDLYALDLTGNGIQNFDDSLSGEFKKLKNLRILHLAGNKIKNLISLNGLKGLELTELVLNDNPINQVFTDQTQLVRYDSAITEIRKRFPKLMKLDNADLPTAISFDVVDEAKLPAPQASFICNPDGRSIVREFLSQYFALYDSDKRSDLIQAYDDNANFSQCSYYSQSQHPNSTNYRLGNYIQDSRNLIKLLQFNRRRSRLHTGKSNVIKCLGKLPKTQHDLTSFVVDLPIFTPNLINLSVSGVFREPDTNTPETSWPVRYFSRSFLIVPVGQGYCIINDSLFVTNATVEQKAAYFKVNAVKPGLLQSPTAAPVAATSAVAAADGPPVDDFVRQQMVQALSNQSGMNLEWSKKCLDETQWNFEVAMWTFTELHKKGGIPPEAFAN